MDYVYIYYVDNFQWELVSIIELLVGVGFWYMVFYFKVFFVYVFNEFNNIVMVLYYNLQNGVLNIIDYWLILLEEVDSNSLVVDIYLMFDGVFFYVINCGDDLLVVFVVNWENGKLNYIGYYFIWGEFL